MINPHSLIPSGPRTFLAWISQGYWGAAILVMLLAAAGSAWRNGGDDPLLIGYLLPPVAALVAAAGGLRLLPRLAARERREELALTGLSPHEFLIPALMRPLARPFAQAAAGILLGHLVCLLFQLSRLPAFGARPDEIAITVILSLVATLGLAAQSMILTAAGMARTLRFCCRERNAGRATGLMFIGLHGLWTAIAALLPWMLAAVYVILAASSEARPRYILNALEQRLLAPSETAPRYMPSFLALVLGIESLWLRALWLRLCSEYYAFDSDPKNTKDA